MKALNRTIAPVMLCVVLGLGIASFVSTSKVEAQPSAPAGTPRFQISAFSSTLGNNVVHGAYVIDTTSGKVWQVRSGGKPEVVAEKLE